MRKLLFFFSSLFILGCNETKKENSSLSNMESARTDCVKQLFEKDSIFGSIRNHASEKASISDAITEYSKNFKSLNFSDCPEGLEVAFQKHIKAWLDFKKVSDKYPSLRGEIHDIFAIIEKGKDSTEFKSKLAQIIETWKIVKESSK